VIAFRDLHKSFGGKPVLSGVSLEIAEGEVMFIIGTSGVGKSVTIKLLVGLLSLDRGEIWLDAERVTCPLRIVWGTADKILEWPRAAERWRASFPHADWVELDGVGHGPQLDVPLEAAQLILGHSAP